MELRNGTTTATIDLGGGRLASFRPDGIEVLVTEGAKPTRWGSFPMVPWCGRLRDGRLSFDGAVHDFPLTSPPHANHGFTHVQAWYPLDPSAPELVDAGELLVAEAAIATDLGDPWPYGGRAVQRFALGVDHLTVTVEVHADRVPMPAMAGWHPWFRRDLGVGGAAELVLDLDGAAVYAVGTDGIPTGELEPVPPGPWDACFDGLGAAPVVRWPGALEVELTSSFDHWVVFTEPEHALCVEPESGAPNDINRVPHVVRPGEPLIGSMTFTWRSLA